MKKAFLLFLVAGLGTIACNKTNSINATYKGIIPCADCEGIEHTLYLTDQGEFVLQSVYLGKSATVYKDSGDYVIDEENALVLDLKNAPNLYLIEPDGVIQLDNKGKKIESKLNYKLFKIK